MTQRIFWVKTVHRAHAVLTIAVVAVLLTLNLTDVLSSDMSVRLFLAIEVPLAIVFLAFTVLRFAYRERSPDAAASGFLDKLEREEPLLRPVVFELRTFWSLCLAIAGKRQVPHGAQCFGYTRSSLTLPVVLIVVSAVELAVVHFIVPWAWLRIALLILTVWVVLFAFGAFATRIVHPHYVTREELTLRWGRQTVLTVPLSNIASVTLETNHKHTQPHIEGERLTLTQFQSTNVLIRFDAPIAAAAPVPKNHQLQGFRTSEVRLSVDDPDEFLHLLSQFPDEVVT